MAGLTLLHLSDIHLPSESIGTQFDLDGRVREALEEDLMSACESVGKVDAVLISGDIAYSGMAQEYEFAHAWLAEICHRIQCPPAQVFVIPGNHDVDLGKVKPGSAVRNFHDSLRQCSHSDIDRVLQQILQSGDGDILFRPFEAFNSFASHFSCHSTLSKLAWQSSLPIDANTNLELIGMNSALISDRSENDDRRGLIVSSFQHSFPRNSRNVYAILCHHPPSWLRDADSFEDTLHHRSSLQFFGHKHRSRRVQTGNSLRLAAGAVHPSRREPDWQPCYNLLNLEVVSADHSRKLNVRVYGRIWNAETKAFAPEFTNEGELFHLFELTLPIVQGRPLPAQKLTSAPVHESNPTTTQPSLEPEERPETMAPPQITMNPPNSAGWASARRRLVYYYLTLPLADKIRIAESLGLIEPADELLKGYALFEKIIDRATAKKCLDKLWNAVVEKRMNNDEPNPFL